MKTLLAAAASLCLVFGAAAAQDEHHDHGSGPNNGSAQSGGNQGGGTGGHLDRGHGPNGNGGGAMNGGAMNGNVMSHGDMRGPHPDNHVLQGGPAAVHRNFDVHRYQRVFNAPRHFRVGTYRAPYGYNYRRWSFGERLPAIYFGRNYWLTNFVLYGLMPPPPDCVWVRYGPDALLVDEYTGEVIQVAYGVFY